MACCRSCQYLDVPPNNAPRKDKPGRCGPAYRCVVPLPMPVLPASVTKSVFFHWPPLRTYMEIGDGEGCPLFKQFSKEFAHDRT